MTEAFQSADPSNDLAPLPADWRRRRVLFVLIMLVGCIVADQALKRVAEATLRHRSAISWLGDAIRFEYTENPGAFLSLGSGLSPHARFLFLTVLVGAVLAGALFYLLTTPRLGKGSLLGLSLLTGGGIGNLIDRVANGGHVIDYLSVGLGPLRTGIFNFADLCITTGTCVLVLSALKPKRHEAPASTIDGADPSESPKT